jgi:sec-independent protein translocase protein TatA
MFGMGMGEIAIIGAIILLFIGPKKLPQLAKGLGEGIRDFQKALKSKDEESDSNVN